MLLLIDADSLIYSCSYNSKQKEFKKLEDAIAKFDQQLFNILNDIEKEHVVSHYIIFNDAKGNFRKLITPKYKANRKDQARPKFLKSLNDYVNETYNSINACGVETDDVVAKYWAETTKVIGREGVMIVSLDKDYKQFPCLYYNYHYKHREIIFISEQQARYNFYEQMIAGDTADNVNYFPGLGVKFAKEYYKKCKTEFSYRRKLYNLFKKHYKSKAKEKYAECYNLLKLRTT